jgi:TrpR-related protein YerC/YecD
MKAMKKYIDELTKAFSTLDGEDDVKRFLRDLLTPTELEEFATRFQIAKLLWTTDKSYAVIAQELKTSTTTVTRVARFLNKEPYEGYKNVLRQLHPKDE